MRSLATRLSLVFLAILIAYGAFALWVAERGARAYFLEFTQRLNTPIAMYMAERAELVRDGAIDRAALAALADDVTMINPSVEVYVLDTDGYVVAQASTANSIAQPRVSLEPIREFLDPDAPTEGRLLLGDNPLRPDDRRAFSVHPIVDAGRAVGYVYAVLAGREHETLLASIRSSYSVRVLVLTLGGALALAALGGSVVFFTLTRRLQRLTDRVQRWRDEESGVTGPLAAASAGGVARGAFAAGRPDEIDRLARAYEDMAARLREQYLALADTDRARRELFAGVSHDLRTPLTALQGYLETLLLKQERLEPEIARRYLSIAHRQSCRLERLVGELFELSRLDGGGVERNLERFSLLELAHDATQDVGIAASERGVTVRVRPIEAPPGHFDVLADIALVQRVFENLLGNALRHVDAGGRIDVVLAREGEEGVRVAIADDGRGMSPEDAARAFEPRFVGGGTGSEDRAGLGLAIVSSIVALHGGTIEIESRPGAGSVFRFTLPTAWARATDDAHARAADPRGASAPRARADRAEASVGRR